MDQVDRGDQHDRLDLDTSKTSITIVSEFTIWAGHAVQTWFTIDTGDTWMAWFTSNTRATINCNWFWINSQTGDTLWSGRSWTSIRCAIWSRPSNWTHQAWWTIWTLNTWVTWWSGITWHCCRVTTF